jgi:hypothetical protein
MNHRFWGCLYCLSFYDATQLMNFLYSQRFYSMTCSLSKCIIFILNLVNNQLWHHDTKHEGEKRCRPLIQQCQRVHH